MVEENDLILPDENQYIIGQDVSDLNTVCGDIVKPFLYYNESDDVQIFYISDLHLDKTVKRLSVFRMKDLCRQNALKWLTMSAKETRQRYPNLIQQLALSDVSDD